MRILFLGVSGGLGGAERVLLDAVGSIRHTRPGWPVRVLNLEDGPLRASVEHLGAACDVLPLPRAFAGVGEFGRGAAATVLQLARAAPPLVPYLRRLRSTLRSWSPDVVHANGIKADVLAALTAPAGSRVIWHVHDYVGTRAVSSKLFRRLCGRVHVIAANSESVTADVRAVVGEQARVRTILNAVDPERFRPEGPLADLDALAGLAPPPAGTVRVGLVSTYAHWKGHDVFLRALAAVKPGLPLRGYVVGGPQYQAAGSQLDRTALEARAARLGLAGRVGFVGFQHETAPVYRALDVVVHASTRPEPFGLVIAEALACGRAVVAAAAGGALELGEDDVSVMRHPAGDAAALAARLEELVKDRDRRDALGRAGRLFAVERLSPLRFAQDVLRLYE